MVRAILDGRKTQTRRIVSGKFALEWLQPGMFTPEYVSDPANGLCPYGAPGDRLWVRETWFPDPPIDGWDGDVSWQDERRIDGVPAHYRKPEHCIFAASWDGPRLRWRPGIHMPRWASRLTLEVTEVRVERLQDICENDAVAEGVEEIVDPERFWRWKNYMPERESSAVLCSLPSARESFWSLWESINGTASLSANPWVWCVSFRRVEP
jgi:hypothetical protein